MPITNNFQPAQTGAAYTPNLYSSFDDMIGKIAHQIIKGVETNDPLAVFDKMPVDNGDTIEQAVERAGTKAGNKGAQCAQSAIEMANLIKKINL